MCSCLSVVVVVVIVVVVIVNCQYVRFDRLFQSAYDLGTTRHNSFSPLSLYSPGYDCDYYTFVSAQEISYMPVSRKFGGKLFLLNRASYTEKFHRCLLRNICMFSRSEYHVLKQFFCEL